MKNKQDELLPCPFCGGNDLILNWEDVGGTWWSVFCRKCLCDLAKRTSKEKAIADWNTRADSALTARVEELEKDKRAVLDEFIEVFKRHATRKIGQDKNQWSGAAILEAIGDAYLEVLTPSPVTEKK